MIKMSYDELPIPTKEKMKHNHLYHGVGVILLMDLITAEMLSPPQMKNVTIEEDRLAKKCYKGYIRPFIRVGEPGYFLTPGHADHAEEIYNLDVRSDDIWVVTFSRSGTTWMQELVWLVANDLDFEAADATLLNERFVFIEFPTLRPEISQEESAYSQSYDFKSLSDLPSPRYVKSHLPFSLLPPKLLDTAKVFYVARDPRDVAVSYYFLAKLLHYVYENIEFKDYWENFKRDLIFHTPILDHVKEAWDRRDHPNLLFTFYEDMQKDIRTVIDRTCEFLGKEYTDEEKNSLEEYLKFNNRKNSYYNFKFNDDWDSEYQFLRKGKSGNWVNYFEGDMRQEAQEFLEKFYNCTDLRFPGVN